MRRVAAALDTGAASLYVYVSGREGLLQAMLDRVTSTVELKAPDPSGWKVQLHSLLQRMHAALVAHPGIAALTLADRPMSEPVLLLAENLLGILLAGGLEAQDAAWACDILVLLVTAVASEDDIRRTHRAAGGADHGEQADELYSVFRGLAPDQFPLLVANAAEMVAGDGQERFHFAIDVVIDGVIARASAR